MRNQQVFIIAEAGVNHNGNPDLAFRLVDVAIKAKANAVKFQTFQSTELASTYSRKAAYQMASTGNVESQLEMLKKLELSQEVFRELKGYCDHENIEFLSTAFDLPSLAFLHEGLGLGRFKIASGEITNAPLLLAFAKTNQSLILSTGMSNLGEIEQALAVIAFGLIAEKKHKPSIAAFNEAYISAEGQKALCEKVILLHCTSQYPAPFADINLRAMDTLRQAFKLNVGYSDHSEGILIPIAAAALGASIIEKHFTLDRNLLGPDHKASLEPTELQQMVNNIRLVENTLGNGIKFLQLSEYETRNVARKRLVAKCQINKGDKFTEHNLGVKRTDFGIVPVYYWDYLDKHASQNYLFDEVIDD